MSALKLHWKPRLGATYRACFMDTVMTEKEVKPVSKGKKLATYMALFGLFVVSGGLLALVLSAQTAIHLKLGILTLIAVLGWVTTRTIVIIARFYESEREAVANLSPVIGLGLLIPALMVAILYGLV